MADTVSWELLRELADYRARRGCALSMYVTLDPSGVPTLRDVLSRVTSLLDDAHRKSESMRPELEHDERVAAREDLERVRSWFEAEFDRKGVQGAAVFAAGLDGLFRPLLLSEPVPDVVRFGKSFALTPLVPLVGRADGALVVAVGRERGQLYRVLSGRLLELSDLTEEQLNRHDQGGWSQANYQRHVDEHSKEHLKDVADELARRVRELRASDVVVVGADETRAQFIELLPADARTAVIGGAHAEAHAGPTELYDVTAPLLREARLLRERETVERWREATAKEGRAAAGWQETLEAASDARVDTLLLRAGVTREAYQCPSDGRASADPGACPLDGSEMLPAPDGADLAVHHTLTHGGSVLTVEGSPDLDPVGGIGALLRF
jgi:peptide chain release factor subunit 1